MGERQSVVSPALTRRLAIIGRALSALAIAGWLWACSERQVAVPAAEEAAFSGLPADALYLNGEVITMAGEDARAEAFAVLGERIVAVGSSDAMRRLAGPATEVVDLEGRAVVPGLYAAHDHFPGAGVVATRLVDLNSPPMGRMTTIDDVVDALAVRAASTPAGAWIQGRGYDDTLLEDGRHPTREDLDRASTAHPIWISHTSGHLGVANSLALEMAGITAATPQPEGGVIRVDPETGEPDGVLEEKAQVVSALIPPMSEDEEMAAYRAAVDLYLRQGVTTTVITGARPDTFRALQKARQKDILDLRVVAMSMCMDSKEPAPVQSAGFVSGFGDSHLKLGGVKIVQDGSNQGYTGYFTEPYHTPYHGDDQWRGYPWRSQEELTAMVVDLHQQGYQIAIHGNGDAAIDQILNAFRAAQEAFPRADARHRIEHCQMVRKDQLDTIAELGITPSFFVGHVFYWGDRHRDIFMGPERAAGISPLASADARGIVYTIHDDTPVTPVDPLQLLWVSANRLTRSNQVLGGEERVAVERALRALTIDAAWQNFEEVDKGSIEVGKLADFVVLSKNPLTIDPLELRDIEVLFTYVGGEAVYRKI
ncbi:amidohydrolase [Parahaliea aestuarii]|uniref:Amidohydrolase n=1 Tax=Parahaliea aestuarii TaxID=1852021 RepID=A0A5C8ZRD7_9GAMM|nr:amidohydrolase [Parahaliea aestuarii]TXS91063.1 amidohydrolase [Parahaliea aestuarii]